MKKNKKKICFICSAGGHLEQINQLKKVKELYNDYFYVTVETKATQNLKYKKYLVKDLYRGKFKLMKLIRIISLFFIQFWIFLNEKPDFIITTGAGVAVPMCLIAKLFRKKIIYIESFARINSTNKTGRFLYKYANLFIVQWEQLKDFYPKAIYGGWIY